jgi:hypothetical protein
VNTEKTTRNSRDGLSEKTADAPAFSFRREDELWTLTFNHKTVHRRNLRGFVYLADLLRSPHAEITALNLATRELASTVITRASDVTDERALQQVRAELQQKGVELAKLAPNDWARRGEIDKEIKALRDYLTQGKDCAGFRRKTNGRMARARGSVTNAINRAIVGLQKSHPELAAHLKASVKTGSICRYGPTKTPDWRF